jgi:membrane-bound metal-dependent hydrolase YbcI (DUF457 family)
MTTYAALVRDPARTSASRVRLWSTIALLSILPDIDMLWGLVLHGNAMTYHRGPTHSILFAITVGALYANLSRRLAGLPKLTRLTAGSIVFTHVAADYLFSPASVSFFWPLAVYWAPGTKSLQDVMYVLVARSFQDVTIIIACILMGGLIHWSRRQVASFQGRPNRT